MRKPPFTPEHISKNQRLPKDALVLPHSITFEQLEEYQREVETKLHVSPRIYLKSSLRKVLPDRWSYGYTKNVNLVNNKPFYEQLKHGLLYKSFVLGYGVGPIHRVAPTKAIAVYVKEHCASCARLKATAIRAYESMANVGGYPAWTRNGARAYICLAAASSSIDSMSAVLWALLFRDTPEGRDVPSVNDLSKKLYRNRGNPQPGDKPHTFWPLWDELCRSEWLKKLKAARDKVVHRGASAWLQKDFGVALNSELGIFKDLPGGLHVKKGMTTLTPRFKRIHLDKIMKGFVASLEKWEKKASIYLAKEACFQSLMDDGVIMDIVINDMDPLSDSSPERIITSPSKAYQEILRKRVQRKTKA